MVGHFDFLKIYLIKAARIENLNNKGKDECWCYIY